MSTIDLNAKVTLDHLTTVLAEMGATLRWDDEPLPGTTLLGIEVEADATDAYDALPSGFFDRDDLDAKAEIDVEAMCALLDACLAGDRAMAITLLPRLTDDAREHDRIEQHLRRGARS